MTSAKFIAGDWGSTHLRLYLCEGERVLDEQRGPGIAAARADTGYAAIIQQAIAPWREAHGSLPLWLAGMVGSRNGWFEVPYVECPADAAALREGLHRFESNGEAVAILPGLACINPLGAPDVMRGEETQIVGALALDPVLAQGRHVIVCLVRIANGCDCRTDTSLPSSPASRANCSICCADTVC